MKGRKSARSTPAPASEEFAAAKLSANADNGKAKPINKTNRKRLVWRESFIMKPCENRVYLRSRSMRRHTSPTEPWTHPPFVEFSYRCLEPDRCFRGGLENLSRNQHSGLPLHKFVESRKSKTPAHLPETSPKSSRKAGVKSPSVQSTEASLPNQVG